MFTSIEALCQEFGLDPSDTVEALLKQLTLRRTLTLSDKTGGECASEAANNNFIRLTEAIEYLRKPATADLALLKNSELDKFAATVANLQLTVERLRLDNSPSPESESAVKKDISNSYRASKQEFCQVF